MDIVNIAGSEMAFRALIFTTHVMARSIQLQSF